MKMLSVVVVGLGVVALLLGIVVKLLGMDGIMGVSPGGYVRGATALYLLALTVMVYDRWYCGAASVPPAAAPKA